MSEFITQPEANLQPPLIDVSDEELENGPEDIALAILMINEQGWLLDPSGVEAGRFEGDVEKKLEEIKNRLKEEEPFTPISVWERAIKHNLKCMRDAQIGEEWIWAMKISSGGGWEHYYYQYSFQPDALADGMLEITGANQSVLRDDLAGGKDTGFKIYKGTYANEDIYFLDYYRYVNDLVPEEGTIRKLMVGNESAAKLWLGYLSEHTESEERQSQEVEIFNILSDELPEFEHIVPNRHKIANITKALWHVNRAGWKLKEVYDQTEISPEEIPWSRAYNDEVLMTVYMVGAGMIVTTSGNIAEIARLAEARENPDEPGQSQTYREEVIGELVMSTDAHPTILSPSGPDKYGVESFEGTFRDRQIMYVLEPENSDKDEFLNYESYASVMVSDLANHKRLESTLLGLSQQKSDKDLPPSLQLDKRHAKQSIWNHSPNRKTVSAYESNPRKYAEQIPAETPPFVAEWQDRILEGVRQDALIEELAAGTGRDALRIIKKGFTNVRTSDVVREFVRMQKDSGLDAREHNVITDDLSGPVDVLCWNALAHHLTRGEMFDLIYNSHDALSPNGVLGFTFYEGEDDERWDDQLGEKQWRYYRFMKRDRAKRALIASGFPEEGIVEIEESDDVWEQRQGKNYGDPHRWVGYIARKGAANYISRR